MGESADRELVRFSPPPNSVKLLRNVSRPTLTVYLPEPDKANGVGMLICPGGAFHLLAVEHEGEQVARWFQVRGVAAFVLKYSVIETSPDDAEFNAYMEALFSDLAHAGEVTHAASLQAVEEARLALALVREHATEWRVQPDRLGMMGFSAGAHVSVGAVLQEAASDRPNFAAPIYPVLFKEIIAPPDAPPLFIAVANDDSLSVQSCLKLHHAWSAADCPVELHIYSTGGHGFGMTKQSLPSDGWIERLSDWLQMQGLL
jgi:acetyl esterase/lipase